MQRPLGRIITVPDVNAVATVREARKNARQLGLVPLNLSDDLI